jgi:hypothetical protein
MWVIQAAQSADFFRCKWRQFCECNVDIPSVGRNRIGNTPKVLDIICVDYTTHILAFAQNNLGRSGYVCDTIITKSTSQAGSSVPSLGFKSYDDA